jgi:hypothetical protein
MTARSASLLFCLSLGLQYRFDVPSKAGAAKP